MSCAQLLTVTMKVLPSKFGIHSRGLANPMPVLSLVWYEKRLAINRAWQHSAKVLA
jgi:hypothetical protein